MFSLSSNERHAGHVLIHQNKIQSDRVIQLNAIAISQMKSLLNNRQVKKLN